MLDKHELYLKLIKTMTQNPLPCPQCGSDTLPINTQFQYREHREIGDSEHQHILDKTIITSQCLACNHIFITIIDG